MGPHNGEVERPGHCADRPPPSSAEIADRLGAMPPPPSVPAQAYHGVTLTFYIYIYRPIHKVTVHFL